MSIFLVQPTFRSPVLTVVGLFRDGTPGFRPVREGSGDIQRKERLEEVVMLNKISTRTGFKIK